MKNNSRAFVNQILVCLLVSIGVSGSIGLGTVWMRYQISHTANANRQLEARIVALDRQISEKTALIEGEQTPDVLRRRNELWRMGLVPPSDSSVQVFDVPENPMQRMASRANRGLFADFSPGGALPAAPSTDAPVSTISIKFALAR